jgi:hypothetical protein
MSRREDQAMRYQIKNAGRGWRLVDTFDGSIVAWDPNYSGLTSLCRQLNAESEADRGE